MRRHRTNAERAEQWADDFDTRPGWTIAKGLAGLIGFMLILALILGLIGWAAGWFNQAKRVTGPANVSNQYAQVIQDWQGMVNASQNACTVQQSHPSSSSGGPLLVEDPTLAYAATYRNVRQDFNRRQQNIFEAKAVGPRGYPRVVPTFDEENKNPIDWCGVSNQLLALHQ